jgi:hypothetical protein
MPHRQAWSCETQIESGEEQVAPVPTPTGHGMGPLVVSLGHRVRPDTHTHTPPRLESKHAGASEEQVFPDLIFGPQTRSARPPSPKSVANPPSGSMRTTVPIPGIPLLPVLPAPASAGGTLSGSRQHALAPRASKAHSSLMCIVKACAGMGQDSTARGQPMPHQTQEAASAWLAEPVFVEASGRATTQLPTKPAWATHRLAGARRYDRNTPLPGR